MLLCARVNFVPANQTDDLLEGRGSDIAWEYPTL